LSRTWMKQIGSPLKTKSATFFILPLRYVEKWLLIFFPGDAVFRAVLDGLVDRLFGIGFQLGDFDVSGIVFAKHFRADFHAAHAQGTCADIDYRYFHRAFF
jgi:hypothetical protein